MAFDGSAICALTDELKKELEDGRISRIIQPDKYELLITVKKDRIPKLLFISVNPSLPLMYLTDEKRQAPAAAPAFCMLLRKHLGGGRIISISQPSLERIIDIEIEHYDEMGDLKVKTLTAELMGKHSNIIFRDGEKILDSIRRVSSLVSSVRQVLPGQKYFIPFSEDKLNPLAASKKSFYEKVFSRNEPLYKALYDSFTGFSPDLAREICFRADADPSLPASITPEASKDALHAAFCEICRILKNKDFDSVIVYKNNEPVFYSPFRYRIYEDYPYEKYESFSALLKDYYGKRQRNARMRQKSADLRQIVQTLINKDNKKYDLQLKQLKDTEKKDKFRVYGELLISCGYSAEPKATSFSCENFYTGAQITIPLDPTLSAIDNAKKYFEKYDKLKRTYEALIGILKQTEEEIDHLGSIMVSLDAAENEADLAQIKKEMSEAGYIKSRESAKKGAARAEKSDPLHFISSDGFDIYVGKNNYQNEYLSFKLARSSDWWFHAKKIPGSHVIVRSDGADLPDKTFEEAASLAAYFSSARDSEKVDVDYTLKKNLKKVPGSKPGFVIYHTNYSMTAKPEIPVSSIKD